MLAFQRFDAFNKLLDCHLANAGTIGKKWIVLQSHLNGGEQKDFPWFIGKENRLLCFFLVFPSTKGNHTCGLNMVDGGEKTFASLIYAVVIREVAMGDAVLVEDGKPSGFSAKVKALIDRCFDFGCRTFEVGNNELAAVEKGIDA